MESLKQNRDVQAEEARSQFSELVVNFEKLQCDIDSSAAEKARLNEQLKELEAEVEDLRKEKERFVKTFSYVSYFLHVFHVIVERLVGPTRLSCRLEHGAINMTPKIFN